MFLQFKPKKNQGYWTVDFDQSRQVFLPICSVWTGRDYEKLRLEKSWVFARRKECQQLCEELNRALRIATKVFNQQKQLTSICGLPS